MMGLPAVIYKAYFEMNGRGVFGCMVLLHHIYLDKDQSERRLRLVAI
jgi:hypothetical protein